MKVYGIVGWKNTGKTTLVERLVGEIAGRGFSVSTVKHTHHNVDVDQKGKDSWRHRRAGARQVILSSSNTARAQPWREVQTMILRMLPTVSASSRLSARSTGQNPKVGCSDSPRSGSLVAARAIG